MKQYEDTCFRRARRFSAFMGEPTGAWGPAAQCAVRALTHTRRLKTADNPQEVAHTFWDSIRRAVDSSPARQLVREREDFKALG